MHEIVDNYVDKWETVRFGGLKCAKTRVLCRTWRIGAYAIIHGEVGMFAILRIHKKRLVTGILLVAMIVTAVILGGVPVDTGEAGAITVAIDAGHGGYDGGVTGLTRHIKESDVNLSIAHYLDAYLSGKGYKTVLTRSSDRAPVETGSLKRRDMDMRLTTIKNANADIAISIHCNFYPSKYRRGIQVFYSIPLTTNDKMENANGSRVMNLNFQLGCLIK